jgi:hypothetical protein
MRTIAVTVLVVFSIAARAAEAPDGGTPPAQAPAAQPAAEKSATGSAAKPGETKDEFNFELTPAPVKPKLLDNQAQRKLESRVKLRRGLLTAHQALGFITLGLLVVTNILGTLEYVDKYGGGTDTGQLLPYHATFASITTVTFTATGLTALFAPNPYPKPIKLDAALLHKVSMGFAAACFITQIILGPIMNSKDGSLAQKDMALGHLVVGWASSAFMTVGTLAYVFK